MPDLFLWANGKARCALARKRAEAFPVAAGTLELNVLTDNVLNTQAALYFFDSIHLSVLYARSSPVTKR
jgi:hypothetical protein